MRKCFFQIGGFRRVQLNADVRAGENIFVLCAFLFFPNWENIKQKLLNSVISGARNYTLPSKLVRSVRSLFFVRSTAPGAEDRKKLFLHIEKLIQKNKKKLAPAQFWNERL